MQQDPGLIEPATAGAWLAPMAMNAHAKPSPLTAHLARFGGGGVAAGPLLGPDAEHLIIDDPGLAAMASGVGGDPGPSDLPPNGDVVPWTGEGDPPEIIVVAQRLENPPSPHAGEFLFWLNYSQMVDWGGWLPGRRHADRRFRQAARGGDRGRYRSSQSR